MHIKIKKNSKNIIFSVILSCYAISTYAVNLGDFHVISSKNSPFKAELNLGELNEADLRSLRLDFFSSDNTTLKDYGINTIIEKRGNNYIAKIISKKSLPTNINDIKIQANVSGQIYEKIYPTLNKTSTKKNNNEGGIDIIKATPLPASKANPTSNTGKYNVKSGDTLYSISGEHSKNLENVSLDQVIVAIYQSNQQAFVNGNMNKLRSGSELALPSSEETAKFEQKSAKLEIMARTTQYNKYRGKLSNFITKRASENSATTSQTGNVNTQNTGIAINNNISDNLKISKATTNSSENEISNKLQNAEQNTLENQQKILEEKQKALEALKNKELNAVSSSPASSNTSDVISNNIAQDERVKDPLGINNPTNEASTASSDTNKIAKITTTNDVASQTKTDSHKKSFSLWPFIFIILGAGGVGFYIYKRKKQQKDNINDEYNSLFIPTKLNTNIENKEINSKFENDEFFNNSFTNNNEITNFSAENSILNEKNKNKNATHLESNADDDHLFSDEIPLITDEVTTNDSNKFDSELNIINNISENTENIPSKQEVEQSISASAFITNNQAQNDEFNLDIPTLSYDDILQEPQSNTLANEDLTSESNNQIQDNIINDFQNLSPEKSLQTTENTENNNMGSGFYDTKLELAKAYLDIEDISGASMLLEELATQNEDKRIQKQAKALLRDINSI